MATPNPREPSADAHVEFPAEFKNCKKCKLGVKQLLEELETKTPNAFLIHIDNHILKPAKPSQGEGKRDKQTEDSIDKVIKLRELERLVSALQNTEGGVILIHLRGGWKRYRHLYRFDNFFRSSRLHVIDDSYVFTNAYKREWLTGSNIPLKTFIKLTVWKAEGVSTVDYNTNVFEDRAEIAKLIQKHLRERERDSGTNQDLEGKHIDKHGIVGGKDEAGAQENYTEENIVIPQTLGASELADYILENLKLTENVTFGRKIHFGTSSSETTELIGYPFQKPDDIVKAVKQKIDDQLSAVNSKGEFGTDIHELGLCEVDYIDPEKNNKYILTVLVNHFNGIVFHDKEGPRAYIVSDGEVKRMDFQQWYQKIIDSSAKSRETKQ